MVLDACGTIAIWMCFFKASLVQRKWGAWGSYFVSLFSLFVADAKQAAYEIRKRSAKETEFKESIFAHSQL
jgi:hypothetical protein